MEAFDNRKGVTGGSERDTTSGSEQRLAFLAAAANVNGGISTTARGSASEASLPEKIGRLDGINQDEFAARLAARDVHAVDELCVRLLGRRMNADYPHHEVERLLTAVVPLNRDNKYTTLVDGLCRVAAGIATDKFQSWSHSMCHLFESYGRESSLLTHDHHISGATVIANEAAFRATTLGAVGCAPRLVGGILRWNLDRLSGDFLDRPWPWKPEGLESPDLLGVFETSPEAGVTDRAFLASKTPREFALYIHSRPDMLSSAHLWCTPLCLGVLHAAIHDPKVAEELVQAAVPSGFIERTGAREFADLRLKIQDAPITPGLFVDVDGTLLGAGKDSPAALNEGLHTALKYLPPPDVRITLMTGGDAGSATELLRSAGVPSEWLPVVSKSTLNGKKLEHVVDDTPSDYQSFGAKKEYRNSVAFVAADPWGTIQRFAEDHPRLMKHEASGITETGTGPVNTVAVQSAGKHISAVQPSVTVVSYRKTPSGPEVVTVEEKQLDRPKPEDPIARYNALFDGVPLWGGEEWKTLDTPSLAAVCRAAIDAGVERSKAARELALAEEEKRTGFERWWRKHISGWKPPEIASRVELTAEVVQRLRSLASWMQGKQLSRFYMGSDMSYLIKKPREVAELLEQK